MIKDYFIFFPPGYKNEEIDIAIDINPVINLKKKAIQHHQTQIKDAKRILNNLKKKEKKIEYFFVLNF